MADGPTGRNPQDDRIVLGLLESLERDSAQSQRRLAGELGIALGLVNSYLRRCVKKGLIKVSSAPPRRYAYYLTLQGFAEKSRLTIDYLSYSFSFFRCAKADCVTIFELARERGFNSVALLGASDLAEIAAVCASGSTPNVVAVVDCRSKLSHILGIPVVSSVDQIRGKVDCFVITDFHATLETIATAAKRFGSDRVLVPSVLRRGPVKNAAPVS